MRVLALDGLLGLRACRLLTPALLLGLTGSLLGALIPPAQVFVLELRPGGTAATAPASPRLELGSQFTMEAWVYLEDARAYGGMIMGKRHEGGDPWVSYMLSTNPGNGFPQLIQSTGQPGSYQPATATTPVPLRAWTHLAGTLDGVRLRLYVNGVEAASAASPGTPERNTSPFVLGSGSESKTALREARVWAVALTPEQIRDRAGRSLTGNEPGLLAAWPLDDGFGPRARDVGPGHLDLRFGVSYPGPPRWVHATTLENGPFFVPEGPFKVPLATPTEGISAAAGLDFDSDGHLDLILGQNDMLLGNLMPPIALHNDGSGHFTDVSKAVFGDAGPRFIAPLSIVVADFDGDGRMDAFVADAGPDHVSGGNYPGGQNRLLLQSEAGHLWDATLTNLPLRNAFNHCASGADFTGDGVVDLFAGVLGTGMRPPKEFGTQLYENDGRGVFSLASSRMPAGMTSATDAQAGGCAAGDFDNDGDVDLILGRYGSGPDAFLLNDGQGRFALAPGNALPPRLTGPNGMTIDMATADFDSDGWLDVVMAQPERLGPGRGRTGLWMNNRDGTFRDASTALPELEAGFAVVGEANGDGRPDVVHVPGGGSQASMQLFLNAGGGRFMNATELLPTEPPKGHLLAGNLSGSGRADLVIAGLDYWFVRNVKPFTGSLPGPTPTTWLLPSSARIGGAAGAYYKTDLTVANTSSDIVWVTAKFLGHDADGSGGVEKGFSLDPGASRTFKDVLGSLFAVESGFGAIQVTGSRASLNVIGQTSTPGPIGGTFGQSVSGSGRGDLIRGGEPRSILGVREDAGFRTNLILSNPLLTPVDVDVALISEKGETLGSRRISLPPLGMKQVSRVVRELGVSGDLSGARLQLSTPVLASWFAAYASVIDNTTNDPRTLLPARSSSILPSSARAQGLGGAFYTTDLSISNTSAIDAAVTLKFLGHDRDGRNGAEKEFTLAPGRSVTYADVLKSVFDVDAGYGAIEVRTAVQGVVATGQTSTPGPTGGTFGQSVPVLGYRDFVTADAPLSILGAREDDAFRTNLILTNTSEINVDVDVTAFSEAGTTLGTRRFPLPPLGMTQVNRVIRELGIAAATASARIVISTPTAGGAVATYAAVIDGTTNDPRTLLAR